MSKQHERGLVMHRVDEMFVDLYSDIETIMRSVSEQIKVPYVSLCLISDAEYILVSKKLLLHAGKITTQSFDPPIKISDIFPGIVEPRSFISPIKGDCISHGKVNVIYVAQPILSRGKPIGCLICADTDCNRSWNGDELIHLMDRASDIRDPFERLVYLEALSQTATRHRFILENVRDVIMCYDKHGTITYITPNVSFWSDFEPEDLIGLNCAELIRPDQHNIALESLQELSRGLANGPHEYLIRHKDRSYHWWRLNCQPIIADGDLKEVISIISNVDEEVKNKQAIIQSEEKYRMLVEHSNDVIYETDIHGHFTFMSPGVTKITGYSPDELIGKHYLDVIPSEHRECISRITGLQFIKKTPLVYSEVPVLDKSGNSLWIGQNVKLIMEEGQIRGFHAVARDINEQKLAEQALEESERKYRLLAENAKDIIFTMDANLKFTYISPSVKSIRGFTVEEAMSQTPSEALTSDSYRMAMDVFQHELEHLDEWTNYYDKTLTLQLEETCKDGSTIWTETTFSPMVGQNNNLNGILGITRDISERKNTETRLFENEERLKAILDKIKDIILIYDRKGIVTYISPGAKNFGFPADYLVGKNAIDLFYPGQIETALQNLNDLNKGIVDSPHEYLVKNPSGEYNWVHMSCQPVMVDGELQEVVSVVSNIDQEVRDREKLIQSEKEYRFLVEHIHEVIILFDLDLNPVYISPSASRLLGLSIDELTDIIDNPSLSARFIHLTPHSIKVINKFIKEEVRKLSPENINPDCRSILELELIHRDGSKIKVETSVSFIRTSSGDINIMSVTRRMASQEEVIEVCEPLARAKKIIKKASSF